MWDRYYALAVVGVVLLLTIGSSGCGGAPSHPNVLLISVDTLRADHLGIYGYPRPTSPHIDELARQGVVFENAYSTSSWTLPSHVSLLTGLYPSFHGVQDEGTKLVETVPTLAEGFRQLGYHTLALVSHFYVSSEFGLQRGFDTFDDSLLYSGPKNPVAGEMVDRFEELLEEIPAKPLFAFVHFFDPHWSYTPPAPFAERFADPEYKGPVDGSVESLSPFFTPGTPIDRPDLQQMIDLYDGEIAYLDSQIGRLLEVLDRRGLLDDLIIVFTADHGEEFKEHGQLGHAMTLFEEQVRVPLIIAGNSAFRPGTRRQDLVSLIDIGPTLMELVGSDLLAQAQGRSLLTTRPDAEMVFSESIRYGIEMRMARSRQHKLIHFRSGDQMIYFDLAQDPQEQSPMAQDPTRGDLTATLADYAAHADRGWHIKFVAEGDNPIVCRGTIRSQGRLVGPRRYFWNLGRYPGSRYARFSRFDVGADGKSLTWEVVISDLTGELWFDTIPPDEPVTFELHLEDESASTEILLANGDRLASGESITLDPSDSRLQSTRRHELGPGIHIRMVNTTVARGEETTLSDEVKERLRALGYIDAGSDNP
ncbi:MAG: sulfatase [Thermoanaerobaculia bacterium]